MASVRGWAVCPIILPRGLIGLCLVIPSYAGSAAEQLKSVSHAVKPVLERVSLRYNMSFSFGFVNSQGRIALAAGLNNRWGKHAGNQYLTPEELIPLGSVAKPWTALLVMQAYEVGRLKLSDPMAKYADRVVQKLWGVTLESFWGPK
eukprot:1125304-Amphidinium_carterae.1